MHHFAADDAGSCSHMGVETGGETEADESFASVRDRSPKLVLELVSSPAARNGSDARRARKNASLGAESRCHDDKSRGSQRLAHIPTRTELVLAALRLR